ncbi:uncharacterized protein LOC123870303 [Maniola jurtina]|uniref:uncharacterized protein LOC123870303 n=1 Tax=Maniola jurtina TaxID=191418 RepID=UPI001E689771|nr:uncharacterized protein LOC123870303 [Maniola jurtina]
MASKLLKCASCEILISEVMAFIWNKINSIDENTLIRICSTAFTSEEIRTAKKLLFEAVPIKRLRTRKNEDNSVKDLEDIIDLLKQMDATDPDRLPIFVARELHRLPPVTFDHIDVTRLLRDLNLIREDLREIKSQYVTQKQLQETLVLTREKSVDYVNRKRGAFVGNSYNHCDSGPMGLRHISSEPLDAGAEYNKSEEYNNISLSPRETGALDRVERSVTLPVEVHSSERDSALSQPSKNETAMQPIVEAVSDTMPIETIEKCSISNKQPSKRETERQVRLDAKPVGAASAVIGDARKMSQEADASSQQGGRQRSMADVVRTSTECNQTEDDLGGEWITVQRKKSLKNRFVSEVGSACHDLKFKAAPYLGDYALHPI